MAGTKHNHFQSTSNLGPLRIGHTREGTGELAISLPHRTWVQPPITREEKYFNPHTHTHTLATEPKRTIRIGLKPKFPLALITPAEIPVLLSHAA